MYALIFFTAFGFNSSTVFTIQGLPSKAACEQMGKELLVEAREQSQTWATQKSQFICKAIPTK